MMKPKIIIALLILFCLIQNNIRAQQINTLYFLENVPLRHTLNPAFMPQNDIYISPTFIGFSQFSVGNNSISLSDVLYPNSITFLDNLNGFYNVLKSPVNIHMDIQTDFIGFGFRQKSGYWTFAITEKLNSFISVPKDLFKLPFFGTTNNETYDFSNLKFDVTKYTEVALGYSKVLNEKMVLGTKFKLNLGTANLSNVNEGFIITAQNNLLNYNGSGALNSSKYSPGGVSYLNVFNQNFKDIMTPYGFGLGLDLGIDYKLTEKIRFSGALLDFGFIGWSKSPRNYNYTVNYNTNLIAPYQQTSTSSSLFQVVNQLLEGTTFDESLTSAFDSGSVSDSTSTTYFTSTKAKINLGFEYKVIENYLSFGVLSNTNMFRNIISEELTISAITKPKEWLNAAISYSLVNGANSFGVGLGLRTGFFHWFVAADFIPYNTYPISNISFYNNKNVNFPSEIKAFNVSAGMNLVFETIKKDDKVVRKAQGIGGLKYSDKKPYENIRKGRYVKNMLFKKSNKGLHLKKNDDCHCN